MGRLRIPLAALLALAATPLSAAAAAPATPELGAMLLRLFLSLAAVVALAFAAAWGLRRLQLGAGAGRVRMRVVESLQVGPKERIVLVALGGRQILLGVAPGRVGLVQALEQPLPDPVAGGREGFAGVFDRVRRGGGGA